jgi:hypothetical protein
LTLGMSRTILQYVTNRTRTTMQQGSSTFLQEQLLKACAAAREGRHNDALAMVRTVKGMHQNNVYLLALERQMEQLREYATVVPGSEVQQQDILESLPALAERAAESPDKTPARFVREKSAAREKEVQAAKQWLVAQYLQHAYAFLVRQEYSNALAEVHRIFIIEPENERARELERSINRLTEDAAHAKQVS